MVLLRSHSGLNQIMHFVRKISYNCKTEILEKNNKTLITHFSFLFPFSPRYIFFFLKEDKIPY